MFLRISIRSLVLAALALSALVAAPLESQSDPFHYVVLGNQHIDARSCASVSCEVVATFVPGAVLEYGSPTHGDIVGGSDEWVEVAHAGDIGFVHGSMFEPDVQRAAGLVEHDVPTASTDNDDLDDSYLAVSMADLTELQLGGYSVQVPSSWQPPEVQLEDTDYWLYYAAFYGDELAAEQRTNLEQLVASVQSGEYDLVLLDPLGEGRLLLMTTPYALESVSQLRDNYNTYAIDSLGATTLTSEVIALPAGDSLHEMIISGTAEFDPSADLVMIPNEESLIIVEVDTPYYASFHYEGVARAIAESIVFD